MNKKSIIVQVGALIIMICVVIASSFIGFYFNKDDATVIEKSGFALTEKEKSNDGDSGNSGNGIGGLSEDIANENPDNYDYYYIDNTLRVAIKKIIDSKAKQRYYVADIVLASPEQFKTAFAFGTYSSSGREGTKEMANDNGAVIAISGDYYNQRGGGIVIRNGKLYRNTSTTREYLMIDKNGDFLFSDGENSAVDGKDLIKDEIEQCFAFGPVLVKDGVVQKTFKDRYDGVSGPNPRAMIGQIDSLHYVFVVVEGKFDDAKGMTYAQSATLMEILGCKNAYNLDGGGSATLVFQGKMVNRPSQGSEREISDCIVIKGDN